MTDRVVLRSGSSTNPPSFMRQGELAYSPGDLQLWVGDATGTAPQKVVLPPVAGVAQSAATGRGALTAFDGGSTQFAWESQPGAVNNWVAVGGQSAVAATLLAQGADTDVSGNFAAQGAGAFNFGNASGRLLLLPDPGGYVQAFPSIQATAIFAGAVNYSAVASVGANVPVALVPVGAAGAALGPGHTISNTGAYAAGRFCIVTGFAAGAVGNTSQAAGSFSFVTGQNGYDQAVTGKRIHSSAILGSNRGTTQIAEHALLCGTSGTTAAVATASGGASNSFNGLQLINNQTVSSQITVAARDTVSGARASWFINAMWTRGGSAAATTLDGSSGTGAPTFSSGTGASTWTVGLSADTTNGAGAITCTGVAGSTIRWSVRVDSSEVANG